MNNFFFTIFFSGHDVVGAEEPAVECRGPPSCPREETAVVPRRCCSFAVVSCCIDDNNSLHQPPGGEQARELFLFRQRWKRSSAS